MILQQRDGELGGLVVETRHSNNNLTEISLFIHIPQYHHLQAADRDGYTRRNGSTSQSPEGSTIHRYKQRKPKKKKSPKKAESLPAATAAELTRRRS